MFVKSYIVKDMSEAMERIRRELGPDAVILSNREIRPKGLAGLFKKRLIEVMVAYEPAPTKTLIPQNNASKPVKEPQKPTPEAAQKEAPPPARDAVPEKAPPTEAKAENGAQLNELYTRLEELKGAVQKINAEEKPPEKKLPQKLSAEVARVYETLVESDVHYLVARKVARQAQEISQRVSEPPEDIAQSLILETLGEGAAMRLKKYRMNVVILVGPTGVGKTTTLVKLAGLFAIDQNLKVGLINTDTYRVAAQEQIKTYAEILDIPLITIYSPDEMEGALRELGDRDVVLIDTAGKSMANKEFAKEIEAYVNLSGADEVLLTVSSSMGYSACKAFLEQFAFLKDAKLVLTKLDEMVSWGNVLNIAYLARRPVAYITTGQNVPYDIERFDAAKAAKNILESAGI